MKTVALTLALLGLSVTVGACRKPEPGTARAPVVLERRTVPETPEVTQILPAAAPTAAWKAPPPSLKRHLLRITSAAASASGSLRWTQ
ncbi:hypothetical protein ACFSC4_04260 [Deinococcus malanensis]|uniref:hypothetical protein n=1 Tax=Deinococcus malanensis TaxID=1706855 RepID=UPI00362C9F88